MVIEYKITIRNQIKTLEFFIYWSILSIAVIVYLFQQKPELLSYFFIYYLVACVPTFLLHVEYYLVNRHKVFIIDTTNRTISFDQNENIAFTHIEKIILYMAPSYHRKSLIRILPFEDYRYAKIKLKNGKFFIFTCFMETDLENAIANIAGVPVEKRKTIIASRFLGGIDM